MVDRGLVIFDLDGTLFQGADATILAVRKAFGEMGLVGPSEDDIRLMVGKPSRDLHAWLSAYCSPEQAPQLVSDVDDFELEFVSDGAYLYPGVPEILAEIRSFAAQMAICTNGPRRYVDRVLEVHGLRGFFERIRHRQPEDRDKASMVRELLAQLVARPAVLVGDRRDDIEAAQQNGLVAIAAIYGYGSPVELARADARAVSPTELPDLVRALLAEKTQKHNPP